VPTVLVVDDDTAVRESTAAVLRTEGYNVLEAADGAAATWDLAAEAVDVLLLDLHMRRVDGTAVLEALERSSTVIVVSAFEYFEMAEIRRRFAPVVFECLRKPVAPRHLLEVVASAAAHVRGTGTGPRLKPVDDLEFLRIALSQLAREVGASAG
jgi:CheY-like chemotaxis protein